MVKEPKDGNNILVLCVPTGHQIYKVPTACQAMADQHPATMHSNHTIFTNLRTSTYCTKSKTERYSKV